MISTRFSIIIAVILAIGFVILLILIRRRRLEYKYAFMWMAMIIALAMIIFIPGCLAALAELFGISDTGNMAFFLAFLFSVFVNLGLTIAVSGNTERIRKMAQQIGINDHEIRKVQNTDADENKNE